MAKSFSSHCMVSHQGHRGVCSLHTLHQDKENFQSQTPASNINQPIPARSADQSMPCYGKRHQVPPCESTDSTLFFWETREGVRTPIIAQGDLGLV